MKLKHIIYLFIITGIVMVGFALKEIIQTNLQADSSVQEAKAAIKDKQSNMQVNEDRFIPKVGEAIGLLKIPKIKSELAIIEGTDPDELAKGVGHYRNSYYPGENGQIVLSGHRDTVFRKLGELELGDSLEVEMASGLHTYEIIKTKIVDADDTSVITLQDNEEELIVTTCYPFSYIGNAPDRYIIYAKKKNEP